MIEDNEGDVYPCSRYKYQADKLEALNIDYRLVLVKDIRECSGPRSLYLLTWLFGVPVVSNLK